MSDQKMSGFYRGVVEDNNDPLKVGRVRVRIFGIHTENKTRNATDGIPTDHLPWAEPCLPVAEGSISGYGVFGVPLQGSHVMVFFENEQINRPIYFGSLPGITTQRAQRNGFNDPTGKYPDKTGSDFDSRAKNKYPHNFVIAVHGGHYIEIDSTPGDERLKVYHKSGSSTEINKDGKEIKNIVDDQDVTISGNKTETIGGTLDITVTGNVTITAPDVTVTGGTVKLADQDTIKKLVHEDFITFYNAHRHGGSAVPDVSSTLVSHATSNTEAS